MYLKWRNITFSPPDMAESETVEVKEAILSGKRSIFRVGNQI